MLRICLDIDGTICENISVNKWYNDVEPLPGAVESLKRLKEKNYYIILQTARHMKTCNGNEGRVLVMGAKLLFDWLEKWEIPYDEVYFGKPHADLFIDDKGVKHRDWETTEKIILEFANGKTV